MEIIAGPELVTLKRGVVLQSFIFLLFAIAETTTECIPHLPIHLYLHTLVGTHLSGYIAGSRFERRKHRHMNCTASAFVASLARFYPQEHKTCVAREPVQPLLAQNHIKDPGQAKSTSARLVCHQSPKLVSR